MSSLQKTIKYIAIGFAVFLAVVIISSIASVVFSVVTAVSGGVAKGHDKKSIDFSDTYSEVESLSIDNATGKLYIKIGETFRVDGENVSEDFTAEVDSDGTLTVTDNNKDFQFLWFDMGGFNNPNSKITIYIPKSFVADETKIDSGAGTVSVEGLKTNYLYISAGAGNIDGRDITSEEVKIDGGIGTITLKNVNFTNADFNCGVGSLDIEGVLAGESKIDCGIGEVDLDLIGNVNDYDLDIDSGIGSIRLNGEKLSDEYETDKQASNSIKVDGGVGDVNIRIEE